MTPLDVKTPRQGSQTTGQNCIKGMYNANLHPDWTLMHFIDLGVMTTHSFVYHTINAQDA
jgi:hypothetical protein